ncbi:hypothetical protein [Saccharopolyspora hirsuta]|uniref:hypothetical protein n=1 Tax=Saccharopolyspora hirsuta TaxID=1837 RepID=UPI001FE38799|nr:hypothetical protein [Saccharopolyspora hirsuta]
MNVGADRITNEVGARHIGAARSRKWAPGCTDELRGEGSPTGSGQRSCWRPGHSFESEREGEAVKKTTPDLETPIFRELNEELGALPEIDVHDFDEHAFDFLREYDAKAAEEKTDEPAEPVAATSGSGSSSRRGGRRRKGD